MADTFNPYEIGAADLLTNGTSGNTYVLILVDASFVFDAEDEYISDIVGAEISGGGYARGTLSNVAPIAGQNNRLAVVDHDDYQWDSLNGHAIKAFIWARRVSSGDAASPLIAAYIRDSVINTEGGSFAVRPNQDDGFAFLRNPS